MDAHLYRNYVKPSIDRVVAAVLLVALAPLMMALTIAIRLKLGTPVLFTQTRSGKEGLPFRLFKFRSMTLQCDASGDLLPDAQRLTPFGRWLRSTSLDELPELWNVLCGDMSLIGPRPLLREYLELYTDEQSRRHQVKPGLTGWAQIQGRNDISWESKFESDVWYVDHGDFLLDMKILLRTLWTVVRRQGISKRGHSTSDKFLGKPSLEHSGSEVTDSPRDVIVLGAGGHAKVVISTLRAAGWQVKAVYDDDPDKIGCQVLGVEIRGSLDSIVGVCNRKAVIAIGDADCRQRLAERFQFDWITVVHPMAFVDPSAALGEGTVVCAGAIIQPCCRIGSHAIICEVASISHDCDLGDLVHIGPGACLAGNVSVGDHSLVGTGSNIIPGVRIGHRAIVGAGASVITDLPDLVVAIGCPAKIVKELSVERQVA